LKCGSSSALYRSNAGVSSRSSRRIRSGINS